MTIDLQIRFLDKPDATSLIPANQLQKIFGGEINLEYNHDQYFPALTKLCFERKAENLERWRKYGENRCGLDEAVIRGAHVPGEKHDTTQVAREEGDVDAENGKEVPNSSAEEAGAAGAEPPTEQLAQTSISDEGSSETTAVNAGAAGNNAAAPPATPGDEKFVEAPLASPAAVDKAAPAIH